jgi:MoaA/NifB/PqqE/SkfB family radical SAM enzyme
MPEAIQYRSAVASVFTTCPYKCGFCTIAETGAVLDAVQLSHYKDSGFIDKIAGFFNRRTTATEKWHLELTGGEPLLMPNLARLCRALFSHGNKVSFFSALPMPMSHDNLRFLLETSPDHIDYIMAAFHPEAEPEEDLFFQKIEALKRRGHHVLLRFVAHPKRFALLPRLERRCRDLDVAFFASNLLSKNYPHAYTEPEQQTLRGYFSSLTQIVLMNGGLNTTGLSCLAGSRHIAVDFLSGLVTPCILVPAPVLGNIFADHLELGDKPRLCPQQGIACNCDIHFEQDVVPGAEDAVYFNRQKQGFVPAFSAEEVAAHEDRLTSRGLTFSPHTTNTGQVQNDQQLVFSKSFVKQQSETWRRKYYPHLG